jgi:hypothetical protein
MPNPPHILLVNPWITDFAAFDLWSMPLGSLFLASLLREGGVAVTLIDCLERSKEEAAASDRSSMNTNRYGTGKFLKSPIEKPEAYAEIPRTYYRYGIHPDDFRNRLSTVDRPGLIWLTSMMTYWHPGVQQTSSALREAFPTTPIWLGGVYARLCTEHARRFSGVDRVFTDAVARLPDLIESVTGFRVKNHDAWQSFVNFPPPALDLAPHRGYAPLLTGVGCPFRCPYCASHLLQPCREKWGSDAIYSEIMKWSSESGVRDFAFYDDALLLDAKDALWLVLEKIIREGLRVRFHTPNALHIRALTPEWCELLHASGFTTLRLGLETISSEKQKQWGGKVETEMFLKAMGNLQNAGFTGREIGTYLLCGLPGQTPEEVSDAIELVAGAGGQPFLAEYSPLPGTAMWEQARAACRYDLDGEPLYHNNTFFACRRDDFTYDDLVALKNKAMRARRTVRDKCGAEARG